MSKVNVEEALDLRLNHNLSYAKIGKLQGVSNVAILKRLKGLLPDEATEVYKDSRADILSHVQLRLLSQVTDNKVKKMSVRDAVVSYGILFDKERLERGQSTAILDAGELSKEIEQIRAQRDVLIEAIKLKKASIAP